VINESSKLTEKLPVALKVKQQYANVISGVIDGLQWSITSRVCRQSGRKYEFSFFWGSRSLVGGRTRLVLLSCRSWTAQGSVASGTRFEGLESTISGVAANVLPEV